MNIQPNHLRSEIQSAHADARSAAVKATCAAAGRNSAVLFDALLDVLGDDPWSSVFEPMKRIAANTDGFREDHEELINAADDLDKGVSNVLRWVERHVEEGGSW